MKKAFKWVSQIISIVLFALVLLLFLMRVTGNDVSLFGYRIYRISSGSMEPVYMTGDLVICKEVDISQLHLGDDITYLSVEGETSGLLISHRLVEEPYQDEEGVWHLQTQGILENAAKDSPITGDQVVGKIVDDCLVLTLIYKVFTSKYGIFLFLIPFAWLIFDEIKNLILIVKDKEVEKNEENI